MDVKEKAVIHHFHRHRRNCFEPDSPMALGWKTLSSQQKRFRVLAGVGKLDNAGVLDPGCGHGDLLTFLDKRFKGIRYTGIDLVPEFLRAAADQHGLRPDCRFFLGDFSRMALPRVDWVLANGVLGYKTRDLSYYTRCIDRFYRTCVKGLAFNMLDRTKFPDHPLLTGHNPEEILSFCRSICSRVECIQDYLEEDFTIFMYKPALTP